MKRTQKQPGEKLNPRQLRNAADDAIAFLRSMVKLVEARGWREVHFDFANLVLCTADTILAPEPEGRGDRRAHVDGNGHASGMFEGFERVPVSVFKDILMLLESQLRKDTETLIEQISNAQKTASADRAA